MHRSTFHATHTASHKSRRSIDRNLHARFRAQTRITTKSTTLHSVEQRQHALCLEGAVLTGFRTTREQAASLLHHDVTRNSAGVRRSVAESVPRLLRNELNQGRFFPGCQRLLDVWHGSCGKPFKLADLRRLQPEPTWE